MTSQSFDPHSSIPYIPQDRMAVAAEMLANLVHSSRDGIDGNNGIVLPLEDPSVRGQGLLPFKRDVHLPFFRNLSFDNGKIDLSQTLFADEPSEDLGRGRALCQDDRAGSAAVQPVCRPQFARGPSLDQVILAKCYEIRIRFFGSLVYRSSRVFVHDGDHVIKNPGRSVHKAAEESDTDRPGFLFTMAIMSSSNSRSTSGRGLPRSPALLTLSFNVTVSLRLSSAEGDVAAPLRRRCLLFISFCM